MKYEKIEVRIHDVAFGGSGVGRLADGKVVFVPFTIAGEKVRIDIHRSTKGFCEGTLIEVLEPSPHRRVPPCPYHGSCGGCQYQHIAYEEQVRMKKKQVLDTLQRIGGFKNLPPPDVVAADPPLGYRNKITLHSAEAPDEGLGFYARDERTVVDVAQCLIANEVVNKKLAELRKAGAPTRHITLVDESQRTDRPDGVFAQVHAQVGNQLIQWIRHRIGPASKGKLLDLYCGMGFFTLGLADLFQSGTGVEQNPHSVHQATLQARKRNLIHINFFAAGVEEKLDWFLQELNTGSDVLILDPPREGLTQPIIEEILKQPIARIVYVSCNPATLARDLKKFANLAEFRYIPSALGCFDMFPQTAQIEVIVELTRSASAKSP